jgi:hypothetical protein
VRSEKYSKERSIVGKRYRETCMWGSVGPRSIPVIATGIALSRSYIFCDGDAASLHYPMEISYIVLT